MRQWSASTETRGAQLSARPPPDDCNQLQKRNSALEPELTLFLLKKLG
jgi:hypothetical protein